MKTPRITLVLSEKIKAKDRPQIIRSVDAVEILRPYYEHDMELVEVCYGIVMNRSNRVLGVQELTRGTATHCLINGRSIAQACLLMNGTGIIIAHNHPSGNTQPSGADEHITHELKRCFKQLDIALMDHVILTIDSYYSFADNGLM
jgi:DNA repair protein RadC